MKFELAILVLIVAHMWKILIDIGSHQKLIMTFVFIV